MNDPAGIKLSNSWLWKSYLAVIFAFFCLFITLSSFAGEQAKTTNPRQGTEDSGDWIFDPAPYTDNPKTGQRVDQYKHEKTPYRDPYSVFDSPGPGFPFEFDGYDSFFFGYPYYSYGMWPFYYPYFYGANDSGLFPYDGDPNEEENEDR